MLGRLQKEYQTKGLTNSRARNLLGSAESLNYSHPYDLGGAGLQKKYELDLSVLQGDEVTLVYAKANEAFERLHAHLMLTSVQVL